MGITLDQESGDLILIQAGPSEGLSSLYLSHLLLERFRIEALEGILWGFSGSSAGKEATCNAGDPGSIPGLGRSLRKGIGYPL